MTTRWNHRRGALMALSLVAGLLAACTPGGVPEGTEQSGPSALEATDSAAGESTVIDTPAAAPAIATRSSGPQPAAPASSSPQTTAGPPVCAVDSGALSIKEGPGTAFQSMGTLSFGDRFTPLERSMDCAWLYGDTRLGQGWSASALLSCPLDFDPCTLPVAAGPPTYTPPAPPPTAAATPTTMGEAVPTLPTGIEVIPRELTPVSTRPAATIAPRAPITLPTLIRPDRPVRTLPSPGGRLPGRRLTPPPTTRPNPRVPPL